MRIRTSFLAGCCAIAALPACARFKTTDQIRNELLVADSTSGTRWYVEPCEVPALDTFGWRADSLGPVRFKIPPLIRVVPNPRFGERSFRYGTGTLNIRLAPDAGIIYQGYVYQSPRWREESCSISDRPADVALPMQKNLFASAIRWSEVSGGEALVAVVRARTLEEFRHLRSTLFTIAWP